MWTAKCTAVLLAALCFTAVEGQHVAEKLGCDEQVCQGEVCEDGEARRPIGANCCACPEDKRTPIDRVMTLLDTLLNDIDTEEDRERVSFVKYDLWCNNTVEEKISTVATSRERIRDLTTLVEKAKGEYGTSNQEALQLKRDIATNEQSQKEANDVRSKEAAGFRDASLETKQALNALDTAIRYLETAVNGRFLETKKKAELSTVTSAIQAALSKSSVSQVIPQQQLELVKPFLESPDAYFGGSLKVSALQNSANPFGDYAPQSDQIRGILKQMRDEFQEDLDALTKEEQFKINNFQELMSSKQSELATMQGSLDAAVANAANRDRFAAQQKAIRDELTAQSTDDQTFLREVRTGCIEKRAEWQQRTNARELERKGVNEAIDALASPEAQKTFADRDAAAAASASAASFIQISESKGPADKRARAYKQLKLMATKVHSAELARLAVALRKGGVFDDVIKQMNNMVAMKRAEEKDDQEHRDRCDQAMDANRIKLENLAQEVGALTRKKARVDTAISEAQANVAQYETDINVTETNLRDLREMRGVEAENHRTSVKLNQDAIGALISARLTLEQLTKKPAPQEKKSFIQVADEPATTTAQPGWVTPKPMTNYEGNYHGHQTEASGIITILLVIEEDIEKETKEMEAKEAIALKEYEEQNSALRSSWEALLVAKNGAQKEVAELMQEAAAVAEEKEQKDADVDAQERIKESLVVDCAWVATHFTKRHEARQAEIDGMVRAIAILEEGNVEEGDRISRTRTGEAAAEDTTSSAAVEPTASEVTAAFGGSDGRFF